MATSPDSPGLAFPLQRSPNKARIGWRARFRYDDASARSCYGKPLVFVADGDQMAMAGSRPSSRRSICIASRGGQSTLSLRSEKWAAGAATAAYPRRRPSLSVIAHDLIVGLIVTIDSATGDTGR
jgi:hypothetical protein